MIVCSVSLSQNCFYVLYHTRQLLRLSICPWKFLNIVRHEKSAHFCAYSIFVKNQKIKKSFFFLKPSNSFKNDSFEGWKTFPYRLTITCRKGHFQASGDSKIQSSSVLHCPAFFPFFQNCPALSYILGYKCPAKSQKMSCIVLHCPTFCLKIYSINHGQYNLTCQAINLSMKALR